jgi:hypothetical protein
MIDTMDPTVQKTEWLVYRVHTLSEQAMHTPRTLGIHPAHKTRGQESDAVL